MSERRITIVGAGLAGALLAALLARRGWGVDVFEKRGDPRLKGYEGGRSINLALAERGLHALRQAEADGPVMAQAVMMRGRMVHFADGRVELQRYGRDDSEVIWSVHRGDLNITLLDIAERAGARLHFHRGFVDADFDACTARYRDGRDGSMHALSFTALIGADGAGSDLRAAVDAHHPLGLRSGLLDHAYKELEIPPAADGSFRIEPNALHIWPRGRYMCIALPNDEKTFTVTLFLPNASCQAGEPSFATVRTPAEGRALFERDFADALPLIPELEADWARNPPGVLGTLTLDRWHLDGRAVLIGDAAHAMVPFHGQGMNCAFEDCVDLASRLENCDDLAAAFAAFEAARKPNASAIQRMALDNYREMRDRVDDPDFLLQRALERVLQERHPGRFVPHYSMVTFMRIPYAHALERSEVQRVILEDATSGLSRIEEVDLAAADAAVLARLQPLRDAA
ncbi:MAG: FAD-dependent oxidoreductase [Luteimonas sp.]